MPNSWKYILAFLVLIVASIWMAVIFYPERKLKLIACDVGQGDAILAVFGKSQILVDGGQNRSVVDCLSRHIPYWDKRIELVVITHPQKDHYGGIVDVIKNYDVEVLLTSGLDSSNQGWRALENQVRGGGVKVYRAKKGVNARLGMIQFEILHPTDAFLASSAEKVRKTSEADVLGAYSTTKDPNDFSVVAILRLGEFDALLTGDIGPGVTEAILEKNMIGDVEYIKVPHHGSKNGLTSDLLKFTTPEIAVISAGKNNPYGHPHKEVLDMLKKNRVQTFRTDQMGDVIVETDGESITIEE